MRFNDKRPSERIGMNAPINKQISFSIKVLPSVLPTLSKRNISPLVMSALSNKSWPILVNASRLISLIPKPKCHEEGMLPPPIIFPVNKAYAIAGPGNSIYTYSSTVMPFSLVALSGIWWFISFEPKRPRVTPVNELSVLPVARTISNSSPFLIFK